MSDSQIFESGFETVVDSGGVAIAQHPGTHHVSHKRHYKRKRRTRVERSHFSWRKVKRKLIRAFVITVAFFGSFALVVLLRNVPAFLEGGYKNAKQKTMQLAIESISNIPKEERSPLLQSVIRNVNRNDIDWAKKNMNQITNQLNNDDKKWLKNNVPQKLKQELK